MPLTPAVMADERTVITAKPPGMNAYGLAVSKVKKKKQEAQP